MRQAQREAWMAQRGRRRDWRVRAWIALSVLLTGIWLITNIAGSGDWGHFWPIWPIGVTGLLTLVRGSAARPISPGSLPGPLQRRTPWSGRLRRADRAGAGPRPRRHGATE